MPSKTYIHAQLEKLPVAEQIKALHKALQLQKAAPQKQPFECIAKAMGVPLFPKVESAQAISPYRLSIHFNDGAAGEVDFRLLLSRERALERALLEDETLFQSFEIREGTLVWPTHGKHLKDYEGHSHFHPYNIDPGLLYEWAVPVEAAG